MCVPAPAAKEHFVQQPQAQAAPYLAQAHPAYSEPQKLPHPAANQFQQVDIANFTTRITFHWHRV